jgi:RHS repeat-associated protein
MKAGENILQGFLLLGLWLGGALTAQGQTRTAHYYYTDPQGNVLAKTDAQGNIIARYDYTPYGAPVPSTGNPPNGLGYTGHVNDPETGLIYMQARYYDPTVGRFMSMDPVTPSPGNLFAFNRYAYVNNNPVVNIDPDGRCIWDGCIFETIVIGAVIGGGIDAAAQHYFHPNQPINKTEVAISAVGGAVTGGSAAVLTGAASAGTITVGQAVLRQAAVSGATAAAQSAAGDVANGKIPSGQAAVNAAGAGIAGSLISSGFSSVAGDFAGASANNAMKDMSNAAINTPAGIGSTIANTTKAIGSTAMPPSALQSAASQAGRVGDIVSTAGEKKLNQNPN